MDGESAKRHQVAVIHDSLSGMVQVDLIQDSAAARKVQVTKADNATAVELERTPPAIARPAFAVGVLRPEPPNLRRHEDVRVQAHAAVSLDGEPSDGGRPANHCRDSGRRRSRGLIGSTSYQPGGASENSEDYERQFVPRVHRLIKLGYDRLNPRQYAQCRRNRDHGRSGRSDRRRARRSGRTLDAILFGVRRSARQRATSSWPTATPRQSSKTRRHPH